MKQLKRLKLILLTYNEKKKQKKIKYDTMFFVLLENDILLVFEPGNGLSVPHLRLLFDEAGLRKQSRSRRPIRLSTVCHSSSNY